jgi:hypothetical protein
MVLMALLHACMNIIREFLQIFFYFLIPRPVVGDGQNRQRDSQLAAQFIRGTLSEVIIH